MNRVLHTDGIAARRRRQKDVSPGTAAQITPKKRREECVDQLAHQVVFSALLGIARSDGTQVHGCFALRHRTREVLGIVCASHMRAELVMDAIQTVLCEVPDPIRQIPIPGWCKEAKEARGERNDQRTRDFIEMPGSEVMVIYDKEKGHQGRPTYTLQVRLPKR